MTAKAGVALRFDHSEGSTNDRITVEIKLEGGFQLPAGAGVGINKAGFGACPGPVGIERPHMQLAGGIIAPEDLIGITDRFSRQHLPGGAGAASTGGRTHQGDRRRGSANLDERLAIATAQQGRIALVFKCGVIIEDRAYNRCRGADAVAAAWGEAEGNGFIRLDRDVRRGIHADGGGGGSSGKAHRLGGGCGGDAGVIGAKAGGTAHGVIHRQGGGGGPCSREGVEEISRAIFRNGGWRDSQADHRNGWGFSINDIKGCLRDAAGAEECGPVGRGGGFEDIVICLIAELDTGESPNARVGIGNQWCAAEGDATEIRTRYDRIRNKVNSSGLSRIGRKREITIVKARYIVSET